jgi:predicted nucleic acid-binding protein
MMVWSEAIQLFLQYADVRLSFTDCVSFALLQRMGITEVFGFDAHFGLMGVMLQPQG